MVAGGRSKPMEVGLMTTEQKGYCLLYVTAPKAEEAEAIARKLVEERLAACTNVLPPITSFYWWEGQLQRDQEVAFIAKTRRDKAQAAIERVKQLHSYQVPAVLVLDVVNGNPDYLAWVDAECLPGAPGA